MLASPAPGLEVSDFNDTTWNAVAEAYIRSAYLKGQDDEVTSRDWYGMPAAQIAEQPREARLGSVIWPHSKLWICGMTRGMYHFSFDASANQDLLDYYEETRGVSESSIQTDFQNRVRKALGELGVLRELTSCIDIR